MEFAGQGTQVKVVGSLATVALTITASLLASPREVEKDSRLGGLRISSCSHIDVMWFHKGENKERKTAYQILSAITFTTNIVLNVFILSRKRFRTQRSNIFMLVLGFTSAFYSIFYICSQHFFYEGINSSGELCRLWNFVNAYVFCLPWIIFVGLNIDRLRAIRHPLSFTEQNKKRRNNILLWIVGCWLVALIPPLPLLFGHSEFADGCDNICTFATHNTTWVLWQGTIAFVLPLIFIIIIWIKIGQTMYEATREMGSPLKKVSSKMFIITAFFLACITPFCIVFLSYGSRNLPSKSTFYTAFSFTVGHTIGQPFLYICLNTALRKAIISSVTRSGEQTTPATSLASSGV